MPLASIGTLSYDNIVAGDHPIVTETNVLISGQNCVIGTVLGRITASGKLKKVDSTAVDGSQAPYAVLATTTDATTGDKTVTTWLCGEFVATKLVFGGSDTFTTHKATLRDLAIYGKTSVIV